MEHLQGTLSRYLQISQPRPIREDQVHENPYHTAERLQAHGLPSRFAIKGFHMESLYRPLHPVGGDLLIAIPRGKKLLVAVADVSGHDLGAALGATLVRGLLRREAETSASLREILFNLDQVLEAELLPGWFTTMFLGEIDPEMGLLRFVGAGHPPQLLAHPDQEEPIRLDSSTCGLGLGLAEAEERVVQWSPNSTLLLYSDGVDSIYGGGIPAEARLTELIQRGKISPLEDLRARLSEDMKARAEDLSDDVSVLLVRASQD
jgi:sigma-B regulation protein RsbU (phosphoserine phosphatase)